MKYSYINLLFSSNSYFYYINKTFNIKYNHDYLFRNSILIFVCKIRFFFKF